MRKIARLIGTGLGLVLVGALFACPASADSDREPDRLVGNSTGGGWITGERLVQGPRELRQLKTKLVDARRFRNSLLAEARRARLEGRPVPPDSASLPVRHAGQVEGYYCGATSGYMIMRYKGVTRSKYNRDRLKQRSMANRAHMKTDLYEVTSFLSGNFRKGLNRWNEGSKRGFFTTYEDPPTRRLKDVLVANIKGYSMPFGVSTIEWPDDTHYNFHPNVLIGHWVVADGYKRYGGGMRMVDPAANASGLSSAWDDVQEKFWSSTGRFNRKFVSTEGHGIVA